MDGISDELRSISSASIGVQNLKDYQRLAPYEDKIRGGTMSKMKKMKTPLIIAVTILSCMALFAGLLYVNLTYHHASYSADKAECSIDTSALGATSLDCRFVLTIKNGSIKGFVPDFDSTIGPGHEKPGVWRVYAIDSKGERHEAKPDSQEKAISRKIPPFSSKSFVMRVSADIDTEFERLLVFNRELAFPNYEK